MRVHEHGQGKQSRKFTRLPTNRVAVYSDQFTAFRAPENFSLINNPEGVLGYLEDVRVGALHRQHIFLDKSDIKELTPDALVLLVACLKDASFTRGMRHRGNAPSDPKLAELFFQSGFFDHVKSVISKPVSRNVMLHRVSRKKVVPTDVKNACLVGIRNTFQSEQIFEPLYEMLIECMSNTNFHADLRRQGTYEWWLYTYADPISRITSYSFIDLGIGIFESIPVREYVRLKQFLGFMSNVDLVDDLISGKIKSRTFAKHRGKGIPQIYANSLHRNIRRFTIIANDVFADFDKRNYYKLKNRFRGTFLYWELHPDEGNDNGSSGQN